MVAEYVGHSALPSEDIQRIGVGPVGHLLAVRDGHIGAGLRLAPRVVRPRLRAAREGLLLWMSGSIIPGARVFARGWPSRNKKPGDAPAFDVRHHSPEQRHAASVRLPFEFIVPSNSQLLPVGLGSRRGCMRARRRTTFASPTGGGIFNHPR